MVIGLARQGKALARYLVAHGAAVVISDIRTMRDLQVEMSELADLNIEYVLGEHPASLLEGSDALFLSGGVPADLPLAQQARQRGIAVLNDAQLFLEACPSNVIGITGSAGKTTTASLAARMAAIAFEGTDRRMWLGGNIGRPLLLDLEQMQAADLAVMELSSFQLELMTVSPHIAGVLNFTPDHLDRHRTMQAYAAAKQHMLVNQAADDWAVLGHGDSAVWSWREQVRGHLASFGLADIRLPDSAYVEDGSLMLRTAGREQRVCAGEEVQLRGEHNLLNVLAACMLCGLAGIETAAMEQAARTFSGVPHRLEFVRELDGVAWYNDSIATTPDRALAAVHAFSEPLIVLLGGHDKDLPWTAFLEQVVARVAGLVAFGEAGAKIERQARELDPSLHIERAPGLEEAVALAAGMAQPGMVVLLSPGCTSFDEFSNYEERGARFREWVRAR